MHVHPSTSGQAQAQGGPHAHHHAGDPGPVDACCGHACGAATAAAPALPPGDGALLLRIPAMDCPSEEGQIRAALERFTEVRGLRFDLAGRTLRVDAPATSWQPVVGALHAAGFQTETLTARPPAAEGRQARRREFLQLAAALAMALAAELVHGLGPDTPAWKAAGMGMAVAAIVLSGLTVLRKGLAALRRAQLNIHALMSVAVIGAFLIGQWPEAAMVMALYSLAELIEARSVERARDAITGLLALSPPQAEVRLEDGRWAGVDAKSVAVGSVVRVKPGERVALDGRVTAGRGAVDQSPVTGESIPVDKAPGDEVFAGTINQGGSLEFEVTRAAGDTVLARIIHAVERAQGQRAPTQRFVDRFAAVYTPAIFVLALAVAVGTPLLLAWPWPAAAYKALVLLVIACPCALVISTPVTVVSGLAAAARRGILIKGGVHLEQARRLQVVALDKTGTLTEGKPRLVEQIVLSKTVPHDRVLRIARSLAGRSDHPVSRAIAAGLEVPALPVLDFAAEPGLGVHGAVDGHLHVLGHQRWLRQRGWGTDALDAVLQAQEAQGRSVSLLADRDHVLALFAVADEPRGTSRQAIADLKALGVRAVMLTGDNASTARAIAAQVGIDDVRADLLPHDKQKLIADLGTTRRVGMVGDGVNDSPSLAAATVGFSMGGAGTDIAKEAADVLIMNDDLRKVAETLRLSRKTCAVLWQNIALALGIKAVFFGLAVFGSASMWMAVFADMGASLLVVVNGLRLLNGVGRR